MPSNDEGDGPLDGDDGNDVGDGQHGGIVAVGIQSEQSYHRPVSIPSDGSIQAGNWNIPFAYAGSTQVENSFRGNSASVSAPVAVT